MADAPPTTPAAGLALANSTTAAAAAAASPAVAPDASAAADVLVQYVVMRGDLIKGHKWNTGGLISNGSHACVAIICEHFDDAAVRAYVDPAAVHQMHKVVLSAKDDAELVATADMLHKNDIKHRVWLEQPDNLRSCLATKPYPRSIIQPLLRHLKLFR